MSNYQLTENGSSDQAPNIRIIFLDALRGFALLGIYWINISVFADDANTFSSAQSGVQPFISDILSSRFTDDIIEGTMRGLFSILFGASAMVFLNEAKLALQGLEIVDRFYRRALLLILFGLIHAYVLLWPYDILYVYGLISMFLFPLRKLSAKILLIAGIILLYVGDLDIANNLNGVFNTATEQSKNIDTIVESTDQEIALESVSASSDISNDNEPVVKITPAVSRPGYFILFQRNISDVVDQQSEKVYTDYIFDVGGMMIIGIALFKLGILYGTRPRKFYLIMMLLGYSIGYLMRDSQIFDLLSPILHLDDQFEDSVLDYNLGRLIVTLGHIGLIGLVLKMNLFKPLIKALVALGRLALTNYVMQTVLSLFVFYLLAPTLVETFKFVHIFYILLLVWLFQISFSLVWLRHFRLGPLEWVWRSLIYGKRQPIRKTPPDSVTT